MRCEEVDIIAFIEHGADDAVNEHVMNCRKCARDSEKLQQFLKEIVPVWAAGRKLEEEVEEQIQSMDLSALKQLPAPLAEKVAALRERSAVARLNKALKRGRQKAEELAEKFSLGMEPLGVPASPKDITKPGKKKTEGRSRKPTKK
jgi:hypothetical protein